MKRKTQKYPNNFQTKLIPKLERRKKTILSGIYILLIISSLAYFKFSNFNPKALQKLEHKNVEGAKTSYLNSLPKDIIIYPNSSLISENKTEELYSLIFESSDAINKISLYFLEEAQKKGYVIIKPLKYSKEKKELNIILTSSGESQPVIIEVIYSLVPTK